jgi:AsmA-like C-terminal region
MRADIKGGRLEALTKSVAGSAFAKGPFDLAFNVQGEGLSPPGVVAGLSGEGTLTLGAGILQSLSAAPLRGVAAAAAKKTIKADKEEIEAEARGVRETITKGTYKFAPATLAFDIKNGTLRVTPATLASAGAETKINGFVELVSLKLDSEWALNLTGGGVKDVPPVSLVFTGTLSKAPEITPAIDTGAIEAYLTMRRMQEDVERLETLDVSGRTEAPSATEAETETATEGVATTLPEESPLEAPPAAPELAEPSTWTAETTPEQPAAKPPATSTTALPSALELLQEEIDAEPVAPAATEPQAAPEPPSSVTAITPPEPAAEPAPQSAPAPAESATASPEAQPGAPAPTTEKPVKKRSATKPRKKREQPDDWRKSVPIFGGG